MDGQVTFFSLCDLALTNISLSQSNNGDVRTETEANKSVGHDTEIMS